ncbi:protein FAR-RED IMPAIRED RESPONSE 1-like [Henckelia pumila]|uniref:protein FAR-RED IMPAIRED RESPONSE 1-like n=1 Tax=Henckelia pumila TaxID=405737 RepID=UPI003C6DBA61
MVDENQRYLLRSARKVSYAQGETLRVMSKVGIKPSSGLSYMKKESHGVENLGFIRKDAYNYLDYVTKGHSRVENGDALELIRYFKTKSNDEDLFYWDVQMDENGRLSNFFFRDSRARIDYEYFAFMSDETKTSFQWLFKSFLESMGGKQQETIFTDQCQAMMNAIESVFHYSQHRLCQWHISKNAPSHLGHLNTNQAFKGMFMKCMHFCDSEEEFEGIWTKMIHDFGIENHSWLRGMYKIRRKWSTAFSNDRFCAGLKATSKSECTNSILKDGGKRTCTLFEFVKRFEEIQKRWRTKESEEDYKCRHKVPAILMKNSHCYDMPHLHILIVLKLMNVHEIPEKYIKMRWMKTIRNRVKCGENFSVESEHESDVVYRNQMMRLCYDLITKSTVHVDVKKFIRRGLQSLSTELNDMLENLRVNDESVGEDDRQSNQIAIRDPAFVRSKGKNNSGMRSH